MESPASGGSVRSNPVRDDAIVSEMEERLGRKLSNNEISNVVHWSREKKVKWISAAEVRERHQAQLSAEELQTLRALPRRGIERRSESHAVTEPQAVAYAMDHVFERKSVAPEHELLAAALAQAPGQVDLSKLKEALRQSPELVPTGKGYSTREILMTELALITAVEDGKSAVAPLHPTYQPADWLGLDQQTALSLVLHSDDRVTGFRGLAGTGKTTVLKELQAACGRAGQMLHFCAPTAAATEVLRKEGFPAVTLESLLREEGRNVGTNTAVVLDEAGAVSVDDVARLLRLGSRVILSGDTSQHGSVKRGDALRIIEEHSPYTFGQLIQIRRQRRADYRRVVELASKKETAKAFAELDRLGSITELSPGEVHRQAAAAYLSAAKKDRSALLVAPTWAEIKGVTEQVRTGLKSGGQLGKEEHEFRVFDSLSWTEAQKRDASMYRVGHVLAFHQAKGGFARHESVEVVGIADGSLRLRRQDGSETSFPSGRSPKLSAGPACFDVGQTRPLNVAAGEKLLLQANRLKRFTNGELVEVKAVEGGSILLTDGRVLPSDYNRFTHGYAVTSHAAQGKTVDAVFVVASSRSLPAVHREQFYVSISRGRDECQVFTDDKGLLRARVTHASGRLAAIEAIGQDGLINFARRTAHRFAETIRRLRPSIVHTPTIHRARWKAQAVRASHSQRIGL